MMHALAQPVPAALPRPALTCSCPSDVPCVRRLAVNDPPIAADDTYSATEDVALTVPTPGVLGNDRDVEGTKLTVSLVSDATKGMLTLYDDGSFMYVPSPHVHGTDSFTYKANDESLSSETATVTINIASGK